MIRKATFFACLLTLLISRPVSAEADHIFYFMDTVKRTDSEDRATYVMLQIWPGNAPHFDYLESVRGATTPTVTARSFSNDADYSSTKTNTKTLMHALKKARVCDLQSESTSPDIFHSSLSVHIGSINCYLTFSSPPVEPRRASIHKLLMDFADDLKIDRPGIAGEEVQTSQGDREPPLKTTIGELLARPAEYDGKRVAITGYVSLGFENNNFCDQTYRGDDTDVCLWLGEPSSFAPPATLQSDDRSWAHVEGVFFKGPAGHLGMWRGEITRLTKTQSVPPPEH